MVISDYEPPVSDQLELLSAQSYKAQFTRLTPITNVFDWLTYMINLLFISYV